MGWPTNLDAPQEQIECSGAISADTLGTPTTRVHCDVGGTMTFIDGKGNSHTRTFIAGHQYVMIVRSVTSVAGGFLGALQR